VLLRQEDIRPWIAPGQLTLVYDRDDLLDNTKDLRYVDHVDNDEQFVLPYADELTAALMTCGGDTCKVPNKQVTFKLTTDSEGRLTTLERDEVTGGCE
jgi:hypothetical protein